MPNSANRSNSGGSGNAGQGAPRHESTSRSSGSKANPERSDLKHGDHPKDRKGDTGRTSSQGRKSASGGNTND